MIKKLALYLITFLAIVIYILSCNETFMRFFAEGWRNEDRPRLLNIDTNKYGDLYGMSYLPEFKTPVGDVYSDERITKNSESIDLYVIGDSFLAHALKPESDVKFLNKTRLKSFWWGYKDKEFRNIVLDKNKINVLLIEVAERFFRSKFSGNSEYPHSILEVYQTSQVKKQDRSESQENRKLSVFLYS